MNALMEKSNKRRNLLQWQVSRLSRLAFEDVQGRATAIQKARMLQLRRAIKKGSK